MGSTRNGRVDRVTAEQLLGGDLLAHGALGRLLTDVTAPPRRRELAGEDAATAVWRTARRRPVPATPRRWRARLTAVKIAAAGLVLGLGGAALAGSVGVFTGPPRPGPDVTHSPPNSTIRSTSPSGPPPTGLPAPGPSAGATGAGASASPSASAALTGLCEAYRAALAAGHGDVLGTPAFAALVAASGGRTRVASFCAALTAPAPAPTPDHPGPTPAPHPSPTPSGHPPGPTGAGAPTAHPTGEPTTYVRRS